MAYPAIDADTLFAYELDEQTLTFTGEAGTTLLGLDTYGGPYGGGHAHYGSWSSFLEQVSNTQLGHIYDTLPNAASSQIWKPGFPSLFKPTPRGMAFFQGSGTQGRDYVVLTGPTSQLKTLSMWIMPFVFGGAVQEILHKEYFDCTPVDSAPNGGFVAPFYGAMQFFITSSASGEWGVSINIGGTVTALFVSPGSGQDHGLLRQNLWNHIGATYDGTDLRIYANGHFVKSVNVPGSIDYGAGAWVLGALRDGSVSTLNACVKRIRFEKVVKPESYFFDCYTAAGGGGGGGPPQVNFG